MSAYRWLDAAHTHVLRLTDGANVPADPKNADFAAIDPADIGAFEAPPAPPLTVTPWQARTALAQAGLLDDIEALIDSLGPSNPAHIAWHYAERIRRDSPLIAALQSQIGLTDAQLDDLFALAKSLSL